MGKGGTKFEGASLRRSLACIFCGQTLDHMPASVDAKRAVLQRFT